MLWLTALSPEQRRNSIEITAEALGLPVVAVEKDWWVTLVLRAVFSTLYSPSLVFKGGTSLSKGWNLIQRFSEDIDLALNREVLGYGGSLSGKKIERLRKASADFMAGDLRTALLNELVNLSVPGQFYEVANGAEEHSDPYLFLNYQSLYDPVDYLPPRVKIELSTRSMMEPFSPRPIRSFIGTQFAGQNFADAAFDVPTVEPRRTFLEKAFLLHEELLRPADQVKVFRMSRHLSDLERLMDTQHATHALLDMELYKEIVSHRAVFYKRGYVDYNTHAPLSINFIPTAATTAAWQADYDQMSETMFYGEEITYQVMITRLETLLQRFRDAAGV